MSAAHSYYGYLLALATSVCVAALGYSVKASSSILSPAEVLAFRTFWMTLLLLPFCYHDLVRLGEWQARSVWARSLFGALGVFCYFTMLKYAPVSTSIILYGTSPLFVILFSRLFLGESMNRPQILGSVLVIVAITLLKFEDSSELSTIVLVVGILGALFAAAAFVCLRPAAKLYSPALIVFTLSLVSFVLAVGLSGLSLRWLLIFDNLTLWAVVLFSLASQVLLTYTYRFLPAGEGVMLLKASIVWAGVVDLMILKVDFNSEEICLYAAIVLGLLMIHTSRQARQASS